MGYIVALSRPSIEDLTGTCYVVGVPNSLWPSDGDDGWDPNGVTECLVVGECVGKYTFPDKKSRDTYIIECTCDGEMYPVTTKMLERIAGGSSRPR